MDVYTYITYTIDSIKRWLNEEGNNDARILHALETVAQKAADLAVIATATNSKELHEILTGLKAFARQLNGKYQLAAPE